jgi:RHS repeat-associated protein
MPQATRQYDLVIGLDLHVVTPPPPAVPIPMLTPFVGFFFDAKEAFTASVEINGRVRVTAGSAARMVPRHIPLGGVFVKPPPSDGEMFMGSSTVLCDGEPQGQQFLPVLTCQDIGMPAPSRQGKASRPGMYLPKAFALPSPLPGAPVLVGGMPTVSAMSLASKVVGPAAARLRDAFLKSAQGAHLNRTLRHTSVYLRKHANRLFRRLRTGDPAHDANLTWARNKVSRWICTVTGHPVDVATGKVFTDFVDFTLPGPLPFALERVWYSCSRYDGPLGHGWHASFDMALARDERALGVRLGDGRVRLFPALKLGQSHFDEQERLTLERHELGYRLTDGPLHYDFLGEGELLPLARIEDRDGARVCFLYEGGRLRTIVDSGGRLWTFHHMGERLSALEGPHPTHEDERTVYARWAYDEAGNLVEARDALGHRQRFAYRERLLVRETLKSGMSFHFSYDEQERCVRTWGDGGLYDHKLSYDPLFQRTTVENSLGHKAIYEHDGAMVHRRTDALGNVCCTEYDSGYRVTASVDELGQRTTHTYDARGNRTSTVLPDGATTSVEYANDLPVRAVDPNGAEWTWDYDPRGRELVRRDPLGHEAHRQYGERGLMMSDDRHFTYDAQGNLASVVDAHGACTRLSHDLLGRVVAVEDARGARQVRTLDLRGRPTEVREPDGNVRALAHDADDNLVHVKDANSEVRLTYSGMSRLAARSEAGTTVHFQYDTEEQLIGVINEHGLAYRFELGPTGHVDLERGFDGLTRRYHRDRAGRVTRVVRPAQRWTTYAHDAVGRVTEVEHFDGTKESYLYRGDGALLSASNDDTSVDFERDALGRSVRETQAWSWDERAGRGWVASEYDMRGARLRMHSSLGVDQHIERDSLGDVKAIAETSSGFSVRFERDPLGAELARAVGHVRSLWMRDVFGRPLTHVIENDDGPLRAVGYQWSANDRLSTQIDSMRGPTRYRHDARGYPALAHYPDGKIDVRIPDAVGNLYRSETRDDRTYGAAGELLRMHDARGETHYSYDPEGNLVTKHEPDGATWHYAWNGAGRLRAVTRPDGSEVTFRYDSFARRVAKTYRGQTTHWLWDGDVPLHEWVEGNLQTLGDAPTREREAELEAHLQRDRGTKKRPITWLFEPASFAPLARVHGSTAQPILCDYLGTPVLITDETGQREWSADTDTHGNLRNLESLRAHIPFRWPGQYEDAETGLSYNRYRYYDPGGGQYASQDPIGLAGGMRPHAYVDDPLAWVDPLGLSGQGGCGTSSNSSSLTPRAARRLAMRKAGIPTTQQPLSQQSTRVPSSYAAGGRQYTYELASPGGGTSQASVQHSLTDRMEGHGPHWEAGPTKPGGQTDPLGRPRLLGGQKVKVDE